MVAAGEGAMTRHWHSLRTAPAIVGLSRLFRRFWRVVAACALVAHPLVFAQADTASLFDTEPSVRAVAAAGVADESIPHERPRVGRVEPGRFDGLRNELISGRRAKLRLNLFDDADFEATFERSAETASGYTLSGPLRGMPFGRAVLVVNDGLTMGRVYTPEGNYSMRGQGDYLMVERMAPQPLRCETFMPPTTEAGLNDGRREILARQQKQPMTGFRPARADGVDKDVPDRAPIAKPDQSTASGSDAADDGDVVDVLVVYPSFVRELEGGYQHMLSLIDLDIATANEVYAASGVELRVKLAGTAEVEYDRFLDEKFKLDRTTISVGMWRDLILRLSERDDGYMDEVHALRDRYSADLVLLHLGGDSHQRVGRYYVGGIAWPVSEVSATNLEIRGFSVARSGDGSFVAHELGHSMGLMHDRHDDPGNEPFPYSHGYLYEHAPPKPDNPSERYRPRTHGTIMSAYRYEGSLLVFSNPELEHPHEPGVRLGAPGDEPTSAIDGPADAVRHLNELRNVLANVRASDDADPCTYEVSGDQGVLPASGGTYRVRVETRPGCAWRAKGGEWVSSVSTEGGTGSAEIEYTVGVNDAYQRPVEMLIEGKVHARPQAGSRPISPVCKRSNRIRYRIEQFHPDRELVNPVYGVYTRCEELDFDADFLASIRTFNQGDHGWGPDGIDASGFRPGDFDGLSGLVELKLHAIDSLPPDLFFGMTGLRWLEVGVNFFGRPEEHTLTAIAPGAFRGLPSLKSLRLGPNRMKRLDADTFEGLSRLAKLEFAVLREPMDGTMTLVPGAFRGLSSLRILNLDDVRLRHLEAGTFEGLNSLTVLDLNDNELESLAPGAFDGMPELLELNLSYNRLRTLPVGVFDGLANLKNLGLWQNQLSELHSGLLRRLTSLEYLRLSSNRLTHLAPGTFTGLRELEWLNLADNRLRSLPTALFEELSSLEHLFLSINRLGTLRSGLFKGLDRLKDLYLRKAGVTALEPGVFNDTPRLQVLDLHMNRLWNLLPGALRGLDLVGLHLEHNPIAPFMFSPTPAVLPQQDFGIGQPIRFALEAVPEAPFSMGAELSASGASLSRQARWILHGESRSKFVTATPDGDGPVTVHVDGVSWRGDDAQGQAVADGGGGGPQSIITIGIDYRRYYTGVGVAPGEPLVLYGFPDVVMTRGRAPTSYDLSPVFSYFLGLDAEYVALSDNASVAGVNVDNDTLTITPHGAGSAEVTVTATGPDGETMTRRFSVTVQAPSVPLVLAGSQRGREGFVRLLNRSGRAGTVRITAVDDSGARREAVPVRLGPYEARHFNSGDFENGNPEKGLREGIGLGVGNWRLELESELDITPLSYVRTEDGFLTSMHETVPSFGNVHRVAAFNPASNTVQASHLRVINPGLEPTRVTVRGFDDGGETPGEPVRYTIPAGGARELSAVQLESGDARLLEGALGDGEGKWRLTVAAENPVVVMSLLENKRTGHLTNLSPGPVRPDRQGVHHVPLFPASSEMAMRQGFVRVINRSDRAGTVRIAAFDEPGVEYGPLELAIGAGMGTHFNSDDLELGAAHKGLSGSTGPGDGDWRLAMTSDLEIEVLAYVRTEDGFLTAVHDTVADQSGRRPVMTFNPGSNTDQVSVLRVVNPKSRAVEVSVVGTDDAGRAPPYGGASWFTVPAGEVLALDAAELEAGIVSQFYSDLEPAEDRSYENSHGYWVRQALGDGEGKWRLSVVTEPGVLVQSLLESPTGHLTNLSSAPGIEAN